MIFDFELFFISVSVHDTLRLVVQLCVTITTTFHLMMKYPLVGTRLVQSRVDVMEVDYATLQRERVVYTL